MKTRPGVREHLRLACAAVTLATAITACSSDGSAQQRTASPQPSKTSPTPTPTYSARHVEARLLSAEEIGDDIIQSAVRFVPLLERKAPMCALSGVTLPGNPKLIIRQFGNRAEPKDEVRYAQLIALYPDARQARSGFEEIRKKVQACPEKQHVPPRRISAKSTLLAHDDTWSYTEDSIAGWEHIRGSEKQVTPRRSTKYNVFYRMHDYALRGNVVITSAYWERTEPDESGDLVAKRATDLLIKQLRKLG